jgi:rhodanese-related sulfurtransferase
LFLKGVAMPRIGVAELRALIDSGAEPVIIDVRSGAARTLDERRIPGAIAVELADIARIAKELPRDRDLVLYCNCPNEASAASASGQLAAQGFTRVRPLAGGLEAWVASGHHVELHGLATPGGLALQNADVA